MAAPENVYQVEIATTPERLWQAITDPEQTRRYYFGALSRSDWEVGSHWTSESEITQIGDRCRLTLTHTGRGPATIEYTSGGWETILAGLKAMIEEGAVAAGM